MNYKSNQYLVSEVWQPEPVKNLVESIPVKEGQNLPNSPEEDVGNYLLAPTYSSKQLRRIRRVRQGKIRDERKRMLKKLMRGEFDD